MSGDRRKISLTIIVGGVLLAGGAGLLSHLRTYSITVNTAVMVAPAQAAELAGIQLREPVNILSASLSNNYEHMKEHVPPYGSDSEMQDRERFATAALDPFALVIKNAGTSRADVALKARTDLLKNQFMSGGLVPLKDPASLETMCQGSSLGAIPLLQAARGFQWLGLTQWADAFDRVAFAKAASSYGSGHAGDPQLLPLVRELDETAVLWDLNDSAALEKRFHLAEVLNPPQSVAARRAHVLRAIVLRDLHKSREAADELAEAWADAVAMKDLTPRDTAELQWLSAIIFFAASRFDQAEPYCRSLMTLGGEHAHRAAELDVFCLERLRHHDEAEDVRRRFLSNGPATRQTNVSQDNHNSQDQSRGIAP